METSLVQRLAHFEVNCCAGNHFPVFAGSGGWDTGGKT